MYPRKTILFSAFSVSTVLAGACGQDVSGNELGDPTYYQDIKPILDAKCVQCHYEGGIAPFSLESYEQASTYAGVSKLAIEQGTMPPWPPNDECNDYVGSRALSDEQKAMFMQWVDRGMAQGDASSPGDPLDTETTTISRVDLTLGMSESYVPQTSQDYYDDYRCFVVEWPEESTKYVTGFHAVPGNRAVVHHVIAFLATPDQADQYYQLDASDPAPGYPCFGATGGPSQEWIGGWAPGDRGYDLPAGLGIEVQPGSLVILQMHYNTLNVSAGGTVEPDQTTIELKLDTAVDKVAWIQPWANPQWVFGDSMLIPANQTDVTHSFAFDATYAPQVGGADTFEIYSAGLHMHMLGKSASLSIDRQNGTSDCLIQIDRWDFDWQGGYALRTPVTFHRGDQLKVECHWDNSAANQPLLNGERLPPQDVFWGEGSTDEMCLGVMLITVP